MGWGRTLLLGDIGNRLDIADTERDVSGIRGELRLQKERDHSHSSQIAALRNENDQLELCVAALVKTLEGKGILSSEEVRRLVELIED
jgi:hypothetical protein